MRTHHFEPAQHNCDQSTCARSTYEVEYVTRTKYRYWCIGVVDTVLPLNLAHEFFQHIQRRDSSNSSAIERENPQWSLHCNGMTQGVWFRNDEYSTGLRALDEVLNNRGVLLSGQREIDVLEKARRVPECVEGEAKSGQGRKRKLTRRLTLF
jgi:hypothetical protein